jgi:hypothetical protein
LHGTLYEADPKTAMAAVQGFQTMSSLSAMFPVVILAGTMQFIRAKQ